VRPITAMLAAFVLLLGVGGCKPRTVTDTSRRLYCQVVPDAPDRDNGDAPQRIVGKVRYYCDPPGVDQLILTLRLQRQSGKTWVDVAKTVVTAKGGQTLPPHREIYNVRQVSVPCATGTFRTLVTGTSSARGFTDDYSLTGPRNTDPCRPGIFAPSQGTG
jgi:hypothetical protein